MKLFAYLLTILALSGCSAKIQPCDKFVLIPEFIGGNTLLHPYYICEKDSQEKSR